MEHRALGLDVAGFTSLLECMKTSVKLNHYHHHHHHSSSSNNIITTIVS
jgi:hypothetical protein